MKKIRLPEDASGQINIMPLMNIIMLLIPFLIMSTEFIRLSVVDTTLPAFSNNEQVKPPTVHKKATLQLHLTVTQSGCTLITQNKRIPTGCDLRPTATPTPSKPTLPRSGKKLPFKELGACLQKIKALFPKEKRVVLLSKQSIPYNTIIATMDTCKGYRRMDRGDKPLFPDIVISPGIL